mmetsp:Transcript_9293/g.26549  ORF Transcript_9293/g.26549 Transcript_9293/m.26549 type:complete len:241 (+) Transcript_9293:111-833(+)
MLESSSTSIYMCCTSLGILLLFDDLGINYVVVIVAAAATTSIDATATSKPTSTVPTSSSTLLHHRLDLDQPLTGLQLDAADLSIARCYCCNASLVRTCHLHGKLNLRHGFAVDAGRRRRLRNGRTNLQGFTKNIHHGRIVCQQLACLRQHLLRGGLLFLHHLRRRRRHLGEYGCHRPPQHPQHQWSIRQGLIDFVGHLSLHCFLGFFRPLFFFRLEPSLRQYGLGDLLHLVCQPLSFAGF